MLDGASYVFQSSYDAADRVYQATLPDNEVLKHLYGPHGLLTSLTSSLGATYLSSVVYNPLLRPNSFAMGTSPSAQVRHTYFGLDGQTPAYPYGRLKSTEWQQGASPLLVNRVLGDDPVGNVLSVNDQVNAESIVYTYDDLDRLLTASTSDQETYTYNEIGNITSQGGPTSRYTYGDAAHKHAVTSFVGLTYAYDANGCMTRGGSQSIVYDPARRPVRVDQNGAPLCRFAYDGDGVRRKRLDQYGTIHYLGTYERNLGNGQDPTEVITKHYFALDRLVAFRKNGSLSYVGTDHLGSTIRVADASFGAVERMRYTSYGVARDPGTNLGTDRRFTGQTWDASIELYWYGSRAYDPDLGRFLQPDPVAPDLGNPQTLNRYAYVLNNPLRYSDPTGHSEEDEEEDGLTPILEPPPPLAQLDRRRSAARRLRTSP